MIKLWLYYMSCYGAAILNTSRIWIHLQSSCIDYCPFSPVIIRHLPVSSVWSLPPLDKPYSRLAVILICSLCLALRSALPRYVGASGLPLFSALRFMRATTPIVPCSVLWYGCCYSGLFLSYGFVSLLWQLVGF